MTSAPLRAVIFDIGRVLVKLDVPRAIEGLSQGVSLSPTELWTAIEKDPRWPSCHPWTRLSDPNVMDMRSIRWNGA